jgi:ketosteroid isomerase-like protein
MIAKLTTSKIVLSLACVSLLLFTVKLSAQSKDEQAVAIAVEFMKAAMISGDRIALENLAAEKLTYGHSSGVLDDKKQFVEKIASGQSDFVSIDLKNQTIAVTGKTAIVRHELYARINDSNKPAEINLKVMLVFQKQKGGWKLLARQAVK